MPDTLETFIHEIARHPASGPFRLPVDGVAQGIPMYDHIVHRSMDISTIQGKVKKHLYQLPNEMHQDICLMLANCFFFNDANDQEVYGKGLQLRQFYMTNIMPRLLGCSQLYEQIAYPDVPFLLDETARISTQFLNWRNLWTSAWTNTFGKDFVDSSLQMLKDAEPCCETMLVYLNTYRQIKGSPNRANSTISTTISDITVNGASVRKSSRKGGRPRTKTGSSDQLPQSISLGSASQTSMGGETFSLHSSMETSLIQPSFDKQRISEMKNAHEEKPVVMQSNVLRSDENAGTTVNMPFSSFNGSSASLTQSQGVVKHAMKCSSSIVSTLPHIHPNGLNESIVKTERAEPLVNSSLTYPSVDSTPPRQHVTEPDSLARSRPSRKRKPSSRLSSSFLPSALSPKLSSDEGQVVRQSAVTVPSSNVELMTDVLAPSVPSHTAITNNIATAVSSVSNSPQLPPLTRTDSNEPADEQVKKLFQGYFDQLSDIEKDKVIDFIQTCQSKICLKRHHHVSLKKITQGTVVKALDFMKNANLLSRSGSVLVCNGSVKAGSHKTDVPNQEECASLDRLAQSMRQQTTSVGNILSNPSGPSNLLPTKSQGQSQLRKEIANQNTSKPNAFITSTPASRGKSRKPSVATSIQEEEEASPAVRPPLAKRSGRLPSFASASSDSFTTSTSPISVIPTVLGTAQGSRRKPSTSDSEDDSDSDFWRPSGVESSAGNLAPTNHRSIPSMDSDDDLSSPIASYKKNSIKQNACNASMFSQEDSDDDGANDSTRPFNVLAMSIIQEEREKQRHQEEQERKLKEEKKNLEIYNVNVPACHRLKERDYNQTCVIYPKCVAFGLLCSDQKEDRRADLEHTEVRWRDRLEGEGRSGTIIPCDQLPCEFHTKRRRIEANPGEAGLSKLLIYGRNTIRSNPILHPREIIQLLPRLDLSSMCLKIRQS